MGDTRYLKKIRRGWYVQIAVPVDLQPLIGKKVVIRSLRTRNLEEAQVLRWEVAGQIKAWFHHLRQQPATADLVALAKKGRAIIEAGGSSPADMQWGLDRRIEEDARRRFGIDPATGDPVAPETVLAEYDRLRRIIEGSTGTLISEALESHLQEIGRRVRGQTLKARRRRVEAFQAHIGDQEVQTITRAHAGDYITRVLVPAPGSIKTKRDTVSDLSTFFGWCEQRGITDHNPFHRMAGTIRDTSRGTAERKQARRRPWSDAEIRRLRRAMAEHLKPDDPLHLVVEIGLYSGMRLNEICSMRRANVHGGAFHVVEGKTDAAIRAVPIHPRLEALIAAQAGPWLVPGLRPGGEDGKRSHGISKRFGRYVRQWGFTDRRLTFHSFRHGFITKLEQAGVPLPTIQLIVGHARQGETLRTYSAGTTQAQLAAAVARVEYEGV